MKQYCIFLGNQKLTDAAFKTIGRNCHDLRHLYMVDCQRITDHTLKSLTMCRNLTVINLADCVRYINKSVSNFRYYIM